MSTRVSHSRPQRVIVAYDKSSRPTKKKSRSAPARGSGHDDGKYVIISDQPHDLSSGVVTGTGESACHCVSSRHPRLRALRSREAKSVTTLTSPVLASIASAKVVVVHCKKMSQLSLLHDLRNFLPASTPIVALCDPNSARGVSILTGGADFVYRPPVALQTIEATKIAHGRRVNQVYFTEPLLPNTPDGSGPSEDNMDASLEVGPLAFEVETYTVVIRGERNVMSRRPFILLHYLASNRGNCCTRMRIMQDVWDLEFDPGTNVVDVQIYKIRKLLGAHQLRNMVQTVRGRGYRLVWPFQ